MSVRVITPPTFLPVSMTEAKLHLNANDFTDHDTMIELYLRAAVSAAESFTGRAFVDQVLDYTLDEFPSSGPVRLPRVPVIEIQSVNYRESAGGSEEVLDSGVYSLDGVYGRLFLRDGASWPAGTVYTFPNQVRVRYRAGMILDESSPVDVSTFPPEIKAAILLTLGTLYKHREDVVVGQSAVSLPITAQHLLRDLRVETSIG